MAIDYEVLFQYLGMAACIGASTYLFYRGQRKVAALFLVSFLLQFQGSLYVYFVELPENTGACWAAKQSYYDCLPLAYKLSVHGSQASTYLLAAAIFVLGIKTKKQ